MTQSPFRSSQKNKNMSLPCPIETPPRPPAKMFSLIPSVSPRLKSERDSEVMADSGGCHRHQQDEWQVSLPAGKPVDSASGRPSHSCGRSLSRKAGFGTVTTLRLRTEASKQKQKLRQVDRAQDESKSPA